MPLHSLHDLMLHELRDLYDAEKRIVKALPKMAKKAHNPELARAFKEHLAQTVMHVRRLEEGFSLLDEAAKKQKCAGMEGLLKEGEKILTMKGKVDPAVCDAAMIGAAQRVEHYEIAAYGCARTYAERMGHEEVVALLDETLEEEKETDKRLTQIAEGEVNEEAMDEEDREMAQHARSEEAVLVD